MAHNNLSSINSEVLLEYAKVNPCIEHITLHGNSEVNNGHIQEIVKECFMNIRIKEFILPFLPKAAETGFKHKTMGHNNYADYDVSQMTLIDMSFDRLAFVAKFMVQNKESFEKLILKNLYVEAAGLALTDALKSKANKIDLKVIHIENVNLSNHGIKHLIKHCKSMKKLQELALINIKGVDKCMDFIEKSFAHHKTLQILNVSGNNLPDFDSIVEVMRQNRSLRLINIRGSKFSVEDLTPIWLGLRDNISVCELEYQRENVVFAFDILQCIEIELILNQEICNTIFPRTNQSLEHKPTILAFLELNDT